VDFGGQGSSSHSHQTIIAAEEAVMLQDYPHPFIQFNCVNHYQCLTSIRQERVF
jgi:hypothetical protein